MANAGYNRGLKYNHAPYNSRYITTSLLESNMKALSELNAQYKGLYTLTGALNSHGDLIPRLVSVDKLKISFNLGHKLEARMILNENLLASFIGSNSMSIRLVLTEFASILFKAITNEESRLVRDKKVISNLNAIGVGAYRLIRDEKLKSLFNGLTSKNARLVFDESFNIQLKGVNTLDADSTLFTIMRFNKDIEPNEVIAIDAINSVVTSNGLFSLEAFSGKLPFLEPGVYRFEYNHNGEFGEVEIIIDFVNQYK